MSGAKTEVTIHDCAKLKIIPRKGTAGYDWVDLVVTDADGNESDAVAIFGLKGQPLVLEVASQS